MKKMKYELILILLIFSAGLAQALTRDEVISNAAVYANYPLQILNTNILDYRRYISQGGGTLDIGPDGIDDRAQMRYNAALKK